MPELNLALYQEAAKKYFNAELPSNTLHGLLMASRVKYHGGKCPVYYVVLITPRERMVIGGNYATSGKPRLLAGEPLDFD